MLYQDDCLKVLPTLPAQSVDLVIADLPYGCTRAKWDTPIDLEILWPELRRVAKPNAVFAMFAAQPFTCRLMQSNPSEFRYVWYWHKSIATGFLDANKRPLKSVEEIAIFSKQTPRYYPQMTKTPPRLVNKKGPQTKLYGKYQAVPHITEEKYPTTLLTFASERKQGHPTAKPTALLEYLIRTYTKEGETVLDPVMGSGSTGVACARASRSFVGIEIEPMYYARARERLGE